MSSFIFPDSFTRKAFGKKGIENDRMQRAMMRKREQKMEMLRKIQNDAKTREEPLKEKKGFRISRVAWIIIALLTLLMVLIMTSCNFNQPNLPEDKQGKVIYMQNFYIHGCTYRMMTVEHDGCLWVITTGSGRAEFIHHPRCTNHETKFR